MTTQLDEYSRAVDEALVDELNKYDCGAFLMCRGNIAFEDFPNLHILFSDTVEYIEVTYDCSAYHTTKTFTQPLQIVAYIIGKEFLKYETYR